MGPVIVALVSLLGLAALSPLADPMAPVWAGVDPTASMSGELSPAPIVRVGPGFEKRGGSCSVRLVIVVPRGELRRLQVDGEEQLLDWSWSFPALVKENEERTWEVAVIHPVTREERRHSPYFLCQFLPPPELPYFQRW
jgi:hypothetical protein